MRRYRKVSAVIIAINLLLLYSGRCWAAPEDKFVQVLDGRISRVFMSPGFARDRTVFVFMPQLEDSPLFGHTLLYRSTDGGNRWEQIEWNIDGEFFHCDRIWLSNLTFDVSGNVFLAGVAKKDHGNEPFLLVSRDGGKRWETLAPSLGGDYLVEIVPLEGKMLGVFSNGTLKLSPDGGRSWYTELKGAVSPHSGSLAVLDEDHYWILTNDGTVLHTGDGGKTWQPERIRLTKGAYSPGEVQLVPEKSGRKTLIAHGSDEGDLYISHDGGLTWIRITAENIKTPGYKLERITSTAGVPGGLIFVGLPRLVLNSEDYGNSWVPLSQGLKGTLVDMACAQVSAECTKVCVATDQGLFCLDFPTRTPVGAEEQAANQPGAASNPQVQEVKFVRDQNHYSVNGLTFAMDAVPFIEGERFYVPVRYLARGLGVPESGIGYSAGEQRVTLAKDDTTISMVAGQNIIHVNSTPRAIPVSLQIRRGRAYLPARYIAEAFGYQVKWDDVTGTVSICK